jgi:glucose-1-phosphate cytidylyltransferase
LDPNVNDRQTIPVVILCGGLGTRLREETEYRPKPLVPVGPMPILWHIMKTYAASGFTNFVLALGYKGEMIKDFFINYDVLTRDFRIELGSKRITYLDHGGEEAGWKIALVDTGQQTMTGGRLQRLKPLLADQPVFMLTYGDGLADIDIGALLSFHRQTGTIATVTGVRPLTRYGHLMVEEERVARFREKPPGDGWINGGYFVMTPEVFSYLDRGDATVLEREPLERLAADGQLSVFKHEGFWQCMDTYREQVQLNELWASGRAPWRIWDEPSGLSSAA